MRTAPRPVFRTTWEAAASLAAAAPDRRLPCPGCAARVKGAGLAAHVHRVHLSGPADMAPGHPVHLGHDRRLQRTTGRLAVVWALAVTTLGATDPEPLRAAARAVGETPTLAIVRHHIATIAGMPVGWTLVAGLAILAALRIAGRGDRARVVVTHQEVVLGHRLGTGTRRVRLPARIELGALIRRVGGEGGESGPGGSAYDERIGSYLRVGEGRRAITIGCRQGTGERKHWTGWTSGPTRRRWDVTLSPTDFVALQYALAAAGAIAPRG
jgi:hypothetical protein